MLLNRRNLSAHVFAAGQFAQFAAGIEYATGILLDGFGGNWLAGTPLLNSGTLARELLLLQLLRRLSLKHGPLHIIIHSLLIQLVSKSLCLLVYHQLEFVHFGA